LSGGVSLGLPQFFVSAELERTSSRNEGHQERLLLVSTIRFALRKFNQAPAGLIE
jgi:hypothetical protein